MAHFVCTANRSSCVVSHSDQDCAFCLIVISDDQTRVDSYPTTDLASTYFLSSAKTALFFANKYPHIWSHLLLVAILSVVLDFFFAS